MITGIQVWDANGNTVMDTTTSVGTVIGVVETGTDNGYLEDGRLGRGTPFFSCYGTDTGFVADPPAISVVNGANGPALQWVWKAGSYAQNCLIVYGVY